VQIITDTLYITKKKKKKKKKKKGMFF